MKQRNKNKMFSTLATIVLLISAIMLSMNNVIAEEIQNKKTIYQINTNNIPDLKFKYIEMDSSHLNGQSSDDNLVDITVDYMVAWNDDIDTWKNPYILINFINVGSDYIPEDPVKLSVEFYLDGEVVYIEDHEINFTWKTDAILSVYGPVNRGIGNQLKVEFKLLNYSDPKNPKIIKEKNMDNNHKTVSIEDGGSISGTVKTGRGKRLEGATVIAKIKSPEEAIQNLIYFGCSDDITDEKGEYRLTVPLIPQDEKYNYKITAKKGKHIASVLVEPIPPKKKHIYNVNIEIVSLTKSKSIYNFKFLINLFSNNFPGLLKLFLER